MPIQTNKWPLNSKLIIFIIIVLTLTGYYFTTKIIHNYRINVNTSVINSNLISKQDVKLLLKNIIFGSLLKTKFKTNYANNFFIIKTSLDIKIQNELYNQIDTNNSRYVAIVLMDPKTGKIIAMLGHNKNKSEKNPCINATFPAASIFKIITTAAFIEKCGYSQKSILNFNGRKYTLYKQQIIDIIDCYTNKISLRSSFAQSINPVFGKIGSLFLGANSLRKYANIFGFNQKISFEMPWKTSSIEISEDPYNWAEIASGFNRQTAISPLHGAIIASTIVNKGIPVEPTIIEHVITSNGTKIYFSHTRLLKRAINVYTAEVLTQLMTATVSSGTARRIFKNSYKEIIFSKLEIGGKTGSICSRSREIKFDWFVGFAKEKYGSEKIVVSAVVAHQEQIGTRASQYAKIAMEKYFQKKFNFKK